MEQGTGMINACNILFENDRKQRIIGRPALP
jgi:hypothetical protein